MEIQFNGMILKGSFLLFTNNRPLKSSDKGNYKFLDGSEVDLVRGIITKDTKANTPQALMLHVLAPGIQTISTGVKNEKPETKVYPGNKLDFDYDGDIIISPTNGNQVTIEENEFCFTEAKGGVIFVTSASYTTTTINTVGPTISNISGGNRPKLKIIAPINAIVTNRSGRVIFTEVDEINLVGGDLDGTKANKIAGNLTNRSAISVLNLGSLVLGTQSSLTINIGSANNVSLTSNSRIDLVVKTRIGKLSINNASSTNITGGNYGAIDIENSGGRLDIVSFTDINNLKISAKSAVKISGKSVNILNITKAGSRVDIEVEKSSKITINCDSAVAISGKQIDSIDVVYADGRVDIETESSTSINVKADGAVKINGKVIKVIDIVFADGRVDIRADELSDITVKSDSAVNIKCEIGQQTVKIESDGRTDLTLAIAKSIFVDSTNSAVSISAYEYLTEPNIKSTSRKSVVMRN